MVVGRQSIFFCTYTKKQGAGDVSPQVYRRNRIIRQLKFLKTSLQATQPPYFEIATLHHVLPRHAGRVWLACRRTVPHCPLTNRAPLPLGEPAPACERASPQTRPHHDPDAPAPRPRRGCVSARVRYQPLSKVLLRPFHYSTDAAIRRREGTIKWGRVISLP